MKSSKFLDLVRDIMRSYKFSSRTEKCYIDWIYRFIIFNNNRNPEEMGAKEIGEFLTDLAVHRRSSLSTQNQAMNALGFLYRKVFKIELKASNFKVSNKDKQLPVVLDRNEVHKLLENLNGEFRLMAGLLYGSGLRLNECLELRVKDIDFDLNQIIIHSENGDNDRKTLLPEILIPHLKIQIEKVKIKLEENMITSKFSGTTLPKEIEIKYPNAPWELPWQYIFPSKNMTIDQGAGKLKQHHRHGSPLQRAIKNAIQKANINKNVSCHSLRHSFMIHLLEDCYDIQTVQELLGHKDVRTTKNYNSIIHRNKFNVRSPLNN